MVFSSLVFLCAFLPLNIIANYFAKTNRQKNAVMLVFSLVFYAWGEPKYVFLLLAQSLVAWGMALAIERQKNKLSTKSIRLKKLFLALACVACLGLLGVFKYGTFVLTNFKSVFGVPGQIPAIALPIGISFYTFQLLSYVADVYRGDVAGQKNFAIVLLYASLFHQCVAGPIVRYKDVENDLLYRTCDIGDINKGVMRFSCGLAKKVLLSNTCGEIVSTLIISDDAMKVAADVQKNITMLEGKSALGLWVGMLFFMLQIYLDFSAYSDMAIGMGLMSGFHYRENFDYPYMSGSVTEFWRRWHISLGTFFRDYVYIPLGGNRCSVPRHIFNMFVVWSLTGLWHGASWNFVLWGIYFFVFLVLEKYVFGKKLAKAPKILGHIYLLAVVFIGWILFKFDNMSVLLTVIKGMLGLNKNGFVTTEIGMYILSNIPFLLVSVLACTPIAKVVKKKINEKSRTSAAVNTVYSCIRVALPSILFVLSCICLVGDSYNPFLYFRF